MTKADIVARSGKGGCYDRRGGIYGNREGFGGRRKRGIPTRVRQFHHQKAGEKGCPEYIKEHDYRDSSSLRPCVQTCKNVS